MPDRSPVELQAGEEILLTCRRHWVYLAWHLGRTIAAGLLPVVAVLILTGITAGLGSTAGRIVIVIAVIWALYWAVRAYFTWYRYQNDRWLITNQRIIDSIRRHWFHHQIASTDLIHVEDMTIRKEGVLPTLVNFGDVRCQTAGQVENFVLSGIRDPGKVLALIDAARDASRRELASGAPGVALG